MKIHSIGKIENKEGKVCAKLNQEYASGLKELEGFSHVQILWWADGCDNEQNRKKLIVEKPYKFCPGKIGVFAT